MNTIESTLSDQDSAGPPNPSKLDQVAVYEQCKRAYDPTVRRRCTFQYLLASWVHHTPSEQSPTPLPIDQIATEVPIEGSQVNPTFYGPRNRTPPFVPDNCIYYTTDFGYPANWVRDLQLTDPIQAPESHRDIFDNRDLIILIFNHDKEVIWFGYLPITRFATRFHANSFATNAYIRWRDHPNPNAKDNILYWPFPCYPSKPSKPITAEEIISKKRRISS